MLQSSKNARGTLDPRTQQVKELQRIVQEVEDEVCTSLKCTERPNVVPWLENVVGPEEVVKFYSSILHACVMNLHTFNLHLVARAREGLVPNVPR